jgi:hypothetical protein
VTSPSFSFRTEVHSGVQIPANSASGRGSFEANQIGGHLRGGDAGRVRQGSIPADKAGILLAAANSYQKGKL